MKKRILSMMTALCLMLALFPVTAFAETPIYNASNIHGIEPWKEYCGDTFFTIDIPTEKINEVRYTSDALCVDDTMTPDEDGRYKLHADWGNTVIRIFLKEGGMISVSVYIHADHTDNDNNHVCDVCSEPLTNKCVDENPKDHKCDVCGAKLSDHSGGTATCIKKATCDYCGEEYGSTNPDNHAGGTEVRNAKEATCTEDGYTGNTHCKSCGEKLSDGTVIPATGHKDEDKDHICDVETCNATISDHSYEWKSEDGKYWQSCTVCGDETEKKTLPTVTIDGEDALCNGRDYPFTITLPDDMKSTVAFFVCNGSRAPISLLESESGVLSGVIDAEMYAKFVDEEAVTLIITAYTQTADGYLLELTKQVKIAPDHLDATDIRNAKASTCTEDGYTGDTYCKVCGEKATDGKTLAKLDHKDENKDHICDREACKAELSKHSGGTATCKDKAICTYCGKSYGDLNAENHTGATDIRNAKDATCTEDGYSGDVHCADCGEKLSDGTSIARIGHSYESKVTKEPTQTSTGIKTYTCKHCGHTYEEVLDSLSSAETLPQTWNAYPFIATLTFITAIPLILAAYLLLKKRKDNAQA